MKEKLFFAVLTLLILLCAGFLSACGGDDEDDDNDDFNPGDDDDDNGSGDDLDDFLNAIPDVDSLSLTLPESNKKAVGELATLYHSTVDFTRDVNEHVLQFLSWVDEITSYDYTDFSGDTYTWGPWVDDGLSPVQMKFEITRVSGDTYDYYLKWAPKNETDPVWVPVWEGHVDASVETARRGEGTFHVYFSDAKVLDPTLDEEGDVHVTYDTVTDGRDIVVEYIDFYSDSGDIPEPIDAQYFYHNHADNSGEFLFDWFDDVQRDETGNSEYPGLEHFWFNTRWTSDGTGRSDVVITDGDLADLTPPVAEYHISECWDSTFLRTHYYEEALLGDDSLVEITEEGNADSCAFDEAMPSV